MGPESEQTNDGFFSVIQTTIMKYLSFFFLSLLLFACGKEEAPAEKQTKTERPVPVRLADVERQNIQLSIEASGIVTSDTEARPAFKTGGVISKMYVSEGAFVKKGQLLATLDLTEINAQVEQAKQAVDKAERDLGRAENLYADSVATLENVQDARTGLTVAQENLKMAEFNRSFSEIRSPISGKVIQKMVNTGEIVGPGMPAYFILGNSSRDWVVKSGLSDRDWARVNVGDKAQLRFDAFPGRSFPAKITQLADTGNPGSGTFDVELALVDNPPRLAAGLIASVEIFPKGSADQTVIPLDALIEANAGTAKIFTLNKGKAEARTVKVAFLHKDLAVISEGLDGVEKVITDGAAYLKEGAKIEVISQ